MSGRSCIRRSFWCCGSCSGLILVIAAGIALTTYCFNPVAPRLASGSREFFLAGSDAPASLANGDNAKPIRLDISFEQALVDISCGPKGAPLHLETLIDEANYEVVTAVEPHDRYILFRLSLRRRAPGFVSLIEEVGEPSQNQLYLRLPSDLVYDLRLHTDRGFYDVDLGGLNLAALDIRAKRCDLSLSCSKLNPLSLETMNFECTMGSFRINDLQNLNFAKGRFNGMLGELTLSNSGDFTKDEIELELSMAMGNARLELPRSARVYDTNWSAAGATEAPEGTEEYHTQVRLEGGVSFGEHTITYRTRLPRADQLMRRLFHETDNPAEVIDRIREIYRENPDRYDFNETLINQFGYQMLQRENFEAAIEIFKFNIEIHSDYANGYDSLAEAYYGEGSLQQAIEFYEKSLEINPYNSNGKKMIHRIQLEQADPEGPATSNPPEPPKPQTQPEDAT